MELLLDLFAIDSKSKKEDRMIAFLTEYISTKYPDATLIVDDFGNIYVKKGNSKTFPCIVAHIDTIFNFNPNKTILTYEKFIFGFDEVNNNFLGLGADDKNGIWVALKCLEKYDSIKLAFFVGEEIGCVGSNKADMTFFKDCRFVLQCDRKNNCDFITSIMGTDLCGTNFIKKIPLANFGYSITSGLSTDVWKLKEKGLKVACCNISCGYYNPHTDREITNFKDLTNCFNLVCWIIENMTDVYKHVLNKSKVEIAKAKSTILLNNTFTTKDYIAEDFDFDFL